MTASSTPASASSSSSLIPHHLSLWLDRLIIGWLFVMAAFAPHSIAVTQGAWLLGLLLWAVRFLAKPRPRLYRTPLDFALLGFIALTLLSAFLSYAPDISLGKMRAVSLFTVVYLGGAERALSAAGFAACARARRFVHGQRRLHVW